MMDDKQAAALRKPFLPAQIGKIPKGGVMLDYVGHAATTDRLLQVDPSWTWEPLATDEHGLPLLDKAGNLWIRLTVAGVTRLGVGDGKSAKEIIGDAIRNAAMRFGVALDLWAKEDLHAQENPEPPAEKPATRTVKRAPRPAPLAPDDQAAVDRLQSEVDKQVAELVTPKQITKIGASMTALGIKDRAEALAFVSGVIGREIETRNELTKDEASRLIDRLERLESVEADKAAAADEAEPDLWAAS